MFNHIVKKLGLTIVVFAVLASTFSVTAQDPSPIYSNIGSLGPSCPPQPSMMDSGWIHYDDGTTVDAIGLNVGGTFEFAIRLTPTELAGYEGCELLVVRWHHGWESANPHSGTIKIYDEGTPTSPGALLSSEPYSVPEAGWFDIPLTNPVPIDVSRDLWVSVQITQAMGEHPAGVGPGPVVPGKGGWISSDGVEWEQLGIDIESLDYNWNIWAQVGVVSEPPAIPQQPQGPSGGVVNVSYVFSTSTVDPEGDLVSYQWDWGDGTALEWTSPSASGIIVYANHAWTKPGTYDIRVKAKDAYEFESGWSDAAVVHIESVVSPVLEIGSISGGLFKINVVIKNTGLVNATSINWSVSLSGGHIFSQANASGRMASIPAGGEATVRSGFILGFGKTTITVHAQTTGSSVTDGREASVFLFIIR